LSGINGIGPRGVTVVLTLDHASLNVNRLDDAAAYCLAELGFVVTLTPEATAVHGRIFLERGYVEVGAAPADGPLLASWHGYFLGTADALRHAAWARGKGLSVGEPELYRGVDGEWLDLTVQRPGWEPLLPYIVQRIAPAELAADWPPPLPLVHPNGAVTLQAVYLVTPEAEQVARLIAAVADGGLKEAENPYLGMDEYVVALAGGRRVVVGRPAAGGAGERWLQQNGPGLFGVSFGTPWLEATGQFLSKRFLPLAALGTSLWVEPHGRLGVWIAFTELRPEAA
jgi:hypothetical protein